MKTSRYFVVGVVASSLLACSGGGGDSQATNASAPGASPAMLPLAWEAPNTTVEHDCTSDVAGYIVYLRVEPGSYATTRNIPASAVACADSAESNSCGTVQTCRYTLTGLSAPAGIWHVAISAYDSNGNESAVSSEIQEVVN